MVAELTGMEIANASLLDEATAAGEAMTLLHRVQSRRVDALGGTPQFFVADSCYPQTIDVLQARAEPLGIELVVGKMETAEFGARVFGALVQSPDEAGVVHDLRGFIERANRSGVLVAVATDLLSLTLLTPPGEMGADVVFGNSQRFGVPMGYGGPHAAFFATREKHVRQAPGRIIGVSMDANGHTAYRMALQTREQHIRREKATSNICTAQALLANIAGNVRGVPRPERPERDRRACASAGDAARTRSSQRSAAATEPPLLRHAADRGAATRSAVHVEAVRARAELQVSARRQHRHRAGRDDGHVRRGDDRGSVRATVVAAKPAARQVWSQAPSALRDRTLAAEALARTSPFLTHPVFNTHHSEMEMMRYIRGLERKDIGLDTSMIPLGSCTMKLNAASEMLPITWAEFSAPHPFAPVEQVAGYQQIFARTGERPLQDHRFRGGVAPAELRRAG